MSRASEIGANIRAYEHDCGASDCARFAACGRARRLGLFSVPRALKIIADRSWDKDMARTVVTSCIVGPHARACKRGLGGIGGQIVRPSPDGTTEYVWALLKMLDRNYVQQNSSSSGDADRRIALCRHEQETRAPKASLPDLGLAARGLISTHMRSSLNKQSYSVCLARTKSRQRTTGMHGKMTCVVGAVERRPHLPYIRLHGAPM